LGETRFNGVEDLAEGQAAKQNAKKIDLTPNLLQLVWNLL
jgi:hypothetical protein